ncbi:septum formation initiator family protein [Candidatus Berkelbacteria bacterium]|nr:septum formation initiator family protein [Candidatus Berkelbacteria bacterium]
MLGFLSRVVLILVLVYTLFLLGRSVYFNYQTNQEIRNLKTAISKDKDEVENLKNLIAYYQTESFKELEARRKLGLKKPGEEVVSVPENIASQSLPEKQKPATILEKGFESPNYQKWWEFVFGS